MIHPNPRHALDDITAEVKTLWDGLRADLSPALVNRLENDESFEPRTPIERAAWATVLKIGGLLNRAKHLVEAGHAA